MAVIRENEIDSFVDLAVGARPEAVGEILDALTATVRRTADHVRTNWQDEQMAKQWDRIATAIEKAKEKYDKFKPF